MSTRPNWRKVAISLAIGAHVLAIGLQNLPDGHGLRRLYSWYIGLSGQTQGWVMFASAPPRSDRVRLVARFDDGRLGEPFGPMRGWSGARLDAITDALSSEAKARAFFGAVRAAYPEAARPVELRLTRFERPLAAGAEYRMTLERVRTW